MALYGHRQSNQSLGAYRVRVYSFGVYRNLGVSILGGYSVRGYNVGGYSLGVYSVGGHGKSITTS